MKVKATIVAPEPPSPQTLADLPDGVMAAVSYQGGEPIERSRDGQLMIGLVDGHIAVTNCTWTSGSVSPRSLGRRPCDYTVVKVIDPPDAKSQTLADLDNGVLADVYLHPNPDHILRRWRSDDHVLGRNPNGCIEVKNSALCGAQPKDYFVRKALGKFIVEFME